MESGEAAAAIEPLPERRVLVEFFFSPDCDDCREVKEDILPDIEARFGGLIELRTYDVTDMGNYLRLVELQERLWGVDAPVAIVVDGAVFLAGTGKIRAGIEPAIIKRLSADDTDAADDGQAPDAPEAGSVPAAAADPVSDGGAPGALVERLRSFGLGGVILAGLVDGFNPCAFSAIIFLITLLGASGVRDYRLLMVGFFYTLAVFCSYMAIGLGAFGLLRVLAQARLAGEILKYAMFAGLCALAMLSFRDAWAFHRGGKASDVKLQLPEGMKRKIHGIMRDRLGAANLALGALGMGVLVTLIEAVCTGQVYLPTLVFLARYSETRAQAMSLLVIYNLMFTVPLIVVIAAAFLGTRSSRFIEWSRRNVVPGKIAMGLLFAALAAIILFV